MNKSNKSASNVYIRIAIFWLSVVFFGALCFYYSIQKTDLFLYYSLSKFRSVLTVVGVFFVAIGLSLFGSYIHKSSIFETFFDFKLLAHWIYDSNDLQRAKLFRQRYKSSKFKNSFIWGTLFSAALAGAFTYALGEPAYIIPAAIIPAILSFLLSLIISKVASNIKTKLKGESFISLDGIYSEGELIPFKGLNYKLEKVEYLSDDNASVLKFLVSHLIGFKRSSIIVYVDVPKGSEEDAERISYILNAFPDDNFAFFEPFKNYASNLFFASDGLIRIENRSSFLWTIAIIFVWILTGLSIGTIRWASNNIEIDKANKIISARNVKIDEIKKMETARNGEATTADNMQLAKEFVWEYLISSKAYDQENLPVDFKLCSDNSVIVASTANVFMKSSLNGENKIKINVLSKIVKISPNGEKIWELDLPEKNEIKALGVEKDGSGIAICKISDYEFHKNEDKIEILNFNSAGKISKSHSLHFHNNKLDIYEAITVKNGKYEILASLNNLPLSIIWDSLSHSYKEFYFRDFDSSFNINQIRKNERGDYFISCIDKNGNEYVSFYDAGFNKINSEFIKNINSSETNNSQALYCKDGFTKIDYKINSYPVKCDGVVKIYNDYCKPVSQFSFSSTTAFTPKALIFNGENRLILGGSKSSIYADSKIAILRKNVDSKPAFIIGKRNADYLPYKAIELDKNRVLVLSRKVYKSLNPDENEIIDDISVIKLTINN